MGVWALALVLVLQLVASSVATAAAGPLPQRDIFGNIICSTAGIPGEEDGGAPHHAGLTDCCSFACSMFWPQLAAPDGLASLLLPAPVHESLKPPRVAERPVGCRPWRTADPRAPPAA